MRRYTFREFHLIFSIIANYNLFFTVGKSYKKKPYFGIIGLSASEKKDKSFANRSFRKAVKDKIKKNLETLPRFEKFQTFGIFKRTVKVIGGMQQKSNW